MIDASNHSGETRAASDLDHVIQQYHRAADEFVRGNPQPIQLLFTRRDDVSLLDPTGGVQSGWEAVSYRQERNAVARDAEPGTFERVVTYITPELASIVEVERFRAKMAGSQQIVPVTLRTTTIFRPEDGTWKVIHRHADPINPPQTSRKDQVVMTRVRHSGRSNRPSPSAAEES
jgi:ketosteroid isomerase-like protein